MKKITILIAFILAITLMMGIFAGCSSVKKTDAYMTKGEFMLLFVSEIGLEPSKDGKIMIELSDNNKYKDAAVALVEIGYLSEEEAVSGLDDAVTKEFVACLCVEHLYFRKTSNVELKDAGKLSDPQACQDAVGHGIVDAENGYFAAYDKMTYFDCQNAIDTMLHIDATSTFSGKADVDVVLKDGVTDVTSEFDDSTLVVIDPSDPDFNNIVSGMSTVEPLNATNSTSFDVMIPSNITSQKQTSNIIATNLTYTKRGNETKGKTSKVDAVMLAKEKNYCSYDKADPDDCIIIRIPKNSFENRKFKIGEYIMYGLWKTDSFNSQAIGKQTYTFCGEVVAINDTITDYFYTYYTVRIASEEEVLDSAKLNGYNSKSNNVNWKAEKYTNEAETKGLAIGGFKMTDSGFKITVSEKATNAVDSWRDAKFEVDMGYTFEVKDIALQIDGFGSVLKGNIDNAICRLDYTVVNTFDASTEMRYTPDNNRNGKFLNNLSRSRFTGANAAGATSIKIARLYADIGYGFNVELYVYLTIEIDGSIHISVENTYGRGFKIKNNKVTPIYDKKTKITYELNVNAEAGVHFDFSLRWIRKKGTPWADVDLEVGLGIDATSKVFVLTEDHGECTAIHRGYVSDAELKTIKNNADVDYCFDCRLYAYFEISGLNKDTKIGKVIRWFDEDFDLSNREEWDIKQYHYEDGGSVVACTRNYDGQEEAELESTKEDTFELDDYKVVIPEYTCGLVRIVAYPVDKNSMDKMGGIRVYVLDDSVAIAHIYNNSIVVEAVSVGSTELIIETKNKRFTQECSITITENNY